MPRKEETDDYYSWEEIEKRILARITKGSKPPQTLLERIKQSSIDLRQRQSAQGLGAPKLPGLPKV